MAINESAAMFVLLSDSYCQSNMCRREWNFALEKNIKIYPVFVQQDFKRTAYDWVKFMIGNSHYCRLDNGREMKKLIDGIPPTKNTNPLRQSSLPPPPPSPVSPVGASNQPIPATATPSTEEKHYLTKQSITEWTAEDIREWCQDKNLGKWCPLLVHYHGPALLELRRVLGVESHLPHFLGINGITVFDLVLFKCELKQIVALSPPRRRSSGRRHGKRTSSVKSSSK